jgi:DNA-3-methyladenine glycosylase I
MTERCEWPSTNDLMIQYHDNEWGTPVHDDQKWFEYLTLDAFQAGLSWAIIMKKREGFRSAFDQFNPVKIASYNEDKIKELIADPEIIRNQLKIRSTVNNAQRFLEVQDEFGSFDNYIWNFVDGKPVINSWTSMDQIPASTELSDQMSKDLIKRGFKFVGTTICYAFMQAGGIVNDHIVKCYRYAQLTR